MGSWLEVELLVGPGEGNALHDSAVLEGAVLDDLDRQLALGDFVSNDLEGALDGDGHLDSLGL